MLKSADKQKIIWWMLVTIYPSYRIELYTYENYKIADGEEKV
jgi:hypothetical protein